MKNKVLKTLFNPIINLRTYYLSKDERNYERIFSNIHEGNIIVSINNIPGIFELDARSHVLRSILISKSYEPPIVELIKKYTDKNRDAINIGANIGLYTNLLATLIESNRKVLSVEPTPNAFKHLIANIRRNNNDEKVITYNGLISNESGIFQMNVIQGMEEYSSLGNIIHSSVANQKNTIITVQGNTLDNLVTEHNLVPGILVIDVEGAELKVLMGAIKTMLKFKPIIISEIVDSLLNELDCNSNQIVKLMEENGYNVYDVENNPIKYPFTGNIIAFPSTVKTNGN